MAVMYVEEEFKQPCRCFGCCETVELTSLVASEHFDGQFVCEVCHEEAEQGEY